MKINTRLLIIIFFSYFIPSHTMDTSSQKQYSSITIQKEGKQFDVFTEESTAILINGPDETCVGLISYDENRILRIFVNKAYRHMLWDEYLIIKAMNILKKKGYESIHYEKSSAEKEKSSAETREYLSKFGFMSKLNKKDVLTFNFKTDGDPMENLIKFYQKEKK